MPMRIAYSPIVRVTSLDKYVCYEAHSLGLIPVVTGSERRVELCLRLDPDSWTTITVVLGTTVGLG